MSDMERAIQIAVSAHSGAKDKAGNPYILHPLNVMQRVRIYGEEAMIAAVLHDVVEDTDWTLDKLRLEGFTDEVIAAVDALTRRKSESYEDFIARAMGHPLGRIVKIADLEENMDIRRLQHDLTEKDAERLRRYQRAWHVLQDATN
jgi:(p)ppGpp synthase/HD superfamily hydrolase